MGLNLEWTFWHQNGMTQHRMDLKIIMLSCTGFFFLFSTITRGLYSFGSRGWEESRGWVPFWVQSQLGVASQSGLTPGTRDSTPTETQPWSLFKIHSFDSRLIEIRGSVHSRLSPIRGWVHSGFSPIRGLVFSVFSPILSSVQSGFSPFWVQYHSGLSPIRGWVHSGFSPIRGSVFSVFSIFGVQSHSELGPVWVQSIRGWVFLGSVFRGSVVRGSVGESWISMFFQPIQCILRSPWPAPPVHFW